MPDASQQVPKNGAVAMGLASIDANLLHKDADNIERNIVAQTAVGAEKDNPAKEMEAAAAAGAATAAEYGSTGEELVSRMALESVGLLVEGLAGQQVREALGERDGLMVGALMSCAVDISALIFGGLGLLP